MTKLEENLEFIRLHKLPDPNIESRIVTIRPEENKLTVFQQVNTDDEVYKMLSEALPATDTMPFWGCPVWNNDPAVSPYFDKYFGCVCDERMLISGIEFDSPVQLLINHDPDRCIASEANGTLEIKKTTHGIVFRANIKDKAIREHLWKFLQSGKSMPMSFTRYGQKVEREEVAQEIEWLPNKPYGHKVIWLSQCRINEISVLLNQRSYYSKSFFAIDQGSYWCWQAMNDPETLLRESKC